MACIDPQRPVLFISLNSKYTGYMGIKRIHHDEAFLFLFFGCTVPGYPGGLLAVLVGVPF